MFLGEGTIEGEAGTVGYFWVPARCTLCGVSVAGEVLGQVWVAVAEGKYHLQCLEAFMGEALPGRLFLLLVP